MNKQTVVQGSRSAFDDRMAPRLVRASGLLFATFVSGCGSSPERDRPPGDSAGPPTVVTAQAIAREIALADSAIELGQARQIEILPDGLVVLGANPPGLFVFGKDGGYVRSIGATGSGPFEYANPHALSAEDDRIHVWDATGHKVISYGSDGAEVTEVTGLPRAVSDLVVRDGAIVFHSGMSPSNYLSVVDTTGQAELDFGNPTIPDLILAMLDGGSRIAATDRYAFFTTAGNLRLYRLDLETMAVDSTDINDDAFELQSADYVDDIQDIVNKFSESIAFISGSSRVVGAHLAGDRIAVEVEHGTLPFDESTPGTRWSRIHLFDEALAYRAVLEVSSEMRTRLGGSIVAADAEHLYFARAPASEEESWVLTAVRIAQP